MEKKIIINILLRIFSQGCLKYNIIIQYNMRLLQVAKSYGRVLTFISTDFYISTE